MPADLYIPRVDLDVMWPRFRDRCFEVSARLRKRGLLYYATRGQSTWHEQDLLFAQGRTILFDAKGERLFKVTDAPGGWSAHNYGIAFDWAFDRLPDVPKLQPGWKREQYTALGEELKRAGLVWGGNFRKFDGPHGQVPGFVTGEQLGVLRREFKLGGLPAVFLYLDRHCPSF